MDHRVGSAFGEKCSHEDAGMVFSASPGAPADLFVLGVETNFTALHNLLLTPVPLGPMQRTKSARANYNDR